MRHAPLVDIRELCRIRQLEHQCSGKGRNYEKVWLRFSKIDRQLAELMRSID